MNETDTPEAQTPKTSHFWALNIGIAIAIVLVSVGVHVALDTVFPLSPLESISVVGSLVSLGGLVLAFFIFRKQSRQSTADKNANMAVQEKLQRLVIGVDGKLDSVIRLASTTPTDSEADDASAGEDLWSDNLTSSALGDDRFITTPSGASRKLYQPGDIPLAVIGTLVKSWEEKGLMGRWTLAYLRGGFRTQGKGNHPWFLVFAPDGDDATLQLWKVTRGPNNASNAVQLTTTAGL